MSLTVRVWADSSPPTLLKSGSPPEKDLRLYPFRRIPSRDNRNQILNSRSLALNNPVRVIPNPIRQGNRHQEARAHPEHRRVSSPVKVSRNSNSGRAIHRLMIICPQFPVLTFSIPAPDSMRRRKPSTAPCSGERRKNAVALNCNFNININLL